MSFFQGHHTQQLQTSSYQLSLFLEQRGVAFSFKYLSYRHQRNFNVPLNSGDIIPRNPISFLKLRSIFPTLYPNHIRLHCCWRSHVTIQPVLKLGTRGFDRGGSNRIAGRGATTPRKKVAKSNRQRSIAHRRLIRRRVHRAPYPEGGELSDAIRGAVPTMPMVGT